MTKISPLRANGLWLAGLLLAATGLLFVKPVSAAGVELAPAYREIKLPDQRAVSFKLVIKNTTSSPLRFNVKTADFTALDDSGRPTLLPGGSKNRYSLKDYLSVDRDQLLLGAGQRIELDVTIANNQTLSDGGHYGAVVFSLDGPSNTPNVIIRQEIAALVFVSKGNGQPGLRLEQLDLRRRRGPEQGLMGDVVVANAGNLHAVPSGSVELLDPVGKVVSSATLNQAAGRVLPETSRRFDFDLTYKKAVFWPGRYRLRVATNAGNRVVSLWLWPPLSLLIGASLLVGITAIWFGCRYKTGRRQKGGAHN